MNCEALVILGPTAVGKTEVGILLAEALNGEIISCDSMQIYKGMDIGTAKPSPQEQKRARFHLIDIVKPNEYYSAASYQTDARKTIDEIRSRGKLPIIVGGTGLYLRALLEGYGIPPGAESREFRHRLQREAEERGSGYLYDQLKQVDSVAAARLNVNDKVRIIRALEVFHTTGTSITEQQTRNPLPIKVRRFGLKLEREALVARIERRVDAMIDAGWQEEVRRLLEEGYSPDLTPMKSLGYRHLAAYQLGQAVSYKETINSIKTDTRRFAKRQMTWFRREPEVEWIDVESGEEKVASHIKDALLQRRVM